MPKERLAESLIYLCEYRGCSRHLSSISPSFLVFHGGSGSTKEEIQTAVNNGVVKMNVDTGLSRFIDLRVIVLTVPKTPNSHTLAAFG
jgi:fructose/tagatose bisphosphate aldolase